MTDAVNHPEHYTSHPSGIECIQVAETMGFNLGNALKYIWRAGLKGDAIEDLRKAAWYLNREIGRREVEEHTTPEPGDVRTGWGGAQERFDGDQWVAGTADPSWNVNPEGYEWGVQYTLDGQQCVRLGNEGWARYFGEHPSGFSLMVEQLVTEVTTVRRRIAVGPWEEVR